jgi:hypothetical protein
VKTGCCMSKKILKIDFGGDFDFLLAGIICGHKDYRLCFELNDSMALQLLRKEDVLLPAGKPVSSTRHSYYSSIGADNEHYHIISNRDKEGTGYYIPEKKNIDYFVLITETPTLFDFKYFVKQLRQITIIGGAYEFDPAEIKSAEAFFLFLES